MAMVVTLILAGMVLLFLETVLPGMIAGLAGLACMAAAIFKAYSDFGAATGTWVLLSVCGILVAGACLWLRYFPHSRFARRFTSQRTIGDIDAAQPELLHRDGTAFTTLRPCGTALIDGRRVDVVTEGGLVERGRQIKVVAIEGMRVVVRAV
jgi:membrane-bound ClpP family serine protease